MALVNFDKGDMFNKLFKNDSPSQTNKRTRIGIKTKFPTSRQDIKRLFLKLFITDAKGTCKKVTINKMGKTNFKAASENFDIDGKQAKAIPIKIAAV